MNAEQSLHDFEQLIAETGLILNQLTVEQGVELMLVFYRRQRAEDCPPESDGDMLLYQWGDNGDGDFELDLTRQFIIADNDEDEDSHIWQLSLTFIFPTNDERKSLGSGNNWCEEPHKGATDHFENFVKGSDAYRAVADVSPLKVELDYFNAG